MKLTYYWKELSTDGLLKEPKEVGNPHEHSVDVNNYGGFDTPEEALLRVALGAKAVGYSIGFKLDKPVF